MKYYFLALGELSEAGTFQSQTWSYLYSWFEQHVDSVAIYTGDDEKTIRHTLSDRLCKGMTRIEPFGGEPCPLFGYCFQMQCANDWLEVRSLRINPDGGITHMFFYRGEGLIADIQIDDGPNFIGINLDSDQRAEIASRVREIENSRMLCDRWRFQITQYAGNEEWEAL